MDWVFLSELAINGALTGLLYSLFAIGLVLIYKASSVPNLAQGGLTMVGAYVVLALSHDAGLPLWVAIPLGAVIMFALGFGIERVALRRLAGRPVVMILMLTLGLDIFLRGTTLAIWGVRRGRWNWGSVMNRCSSATSSSVASIWSAQRSRSRSLSPSCCFSAREPA
nr:branched-chain amino acid ABC transporter permease [Salipiger thiooxidans]